MRKDTIRCDLPGCDSEVDHDKIISSGWARVDILNGQNVVKRDVCPLHVQALATATGTSTKKLAEIGIHSTSSTPDDAPTAAPKSYSVTWGADPIAPSAQFILARLRKAGDCDRAVRLVEELLGHSAAQTHEGHSATADLPRLFTFALCVLDTSASADFQGIDMSALAGAAKDLVLQLGEWDPAANNYVFRAGNGALYCPGCNKHFHVSDKHHH